RRRRNVPARSRRGHRVRELFFGGAPTAEVGLARTRPFDGRVDIRGLSFVGVPDGRRVQRLLPAQCVKMVRCSSAPESIEWAGAALLCGKDPARNPFGGVAVGRDRDVPLLAVRRIEMVARPAAVEPVQGDGPWVAAGETPARHAFVLVPDVGGRERLRHGGRVEMVFLRCAVEAVERDLLAGGGGRRHPAPKKEPTGHPQAGFENGHGAPLMLGCVYRAVALPSMMVSNPRAGSIDLSWLTTSGWAGAPWS